MPADEEAEVERTLTFNQPDTPVEGVATLNGLEARNLFSSSSVTDSTVTNSPSTQSSLAAWVSPEHNGLWLHNTCATTFFGFDKDIAPEDIALSALSDTLNKTP